MRPKPVLALLLATGACASAGKFGDNGGGNDAPSPSPPIDAAMPIDAARVIDAARPIDAAKPIDAEMIDAEMIDARPIDARPIDAPPDACTPTTTQLLANPSFDASPTGTGWTQKPIQNAPGGPYPLITTDGVVTPNTSPDQAYLGGITGDDVNPEQAHVSDELYQEITVPAGTTQLVLTGFYFVASAENPDDPTVYDTGSAALVTTTGALIETVMSVSNVTAASMSGYVAFSHAFTTDVAGQTVHLKFGSTNDEINPTDFYWDTLSLEATGCP